MFRSLYAEAARIVANSYLAGDQKREKFLYRKRKADKFPYTYAMR